MDELISVQNSYFMPPENTRKPWNIEAATGRVLLKKMFVKISQIAQEKPCARVSFLMKL